MGHRTVRIDGTTDLHNYYPESWQKRDSNYRKTTKSGMFTTRRTGRSARAVAALHSRLSRGQYVYLITHTMGDMANDRTRREMFRKFVDRVRKFDSVDGYMWTTERHKSGKLHHHLVLRMLKPWDYRKVVVSLSLRYTREPNGLDIRPPSWSRNAQSESQAGMYAVKAFWYAVKDTKEKEPDELPFRWWGTSKVIRSAQVLDEDLPTLYSLASKVVWATCARVSTRWAIEIVAEQQKVLDLQRHAIKRAKKNKGT